MTDEKPTVKITVSDAIKISNIIQDRKRYLTDCASVVGRCLSEESMGAIDSKIGDLSRIQHRITKELRRPRGQ